MQGALIGILMGMLGKFVTEKFFSKILIACLRAWSKQSANQLDDQVVAAMADALGVPVDSMPKAP